MIHKKFFSELAMFVFRFPYSSLPAALMIGRKEESEEMNTVHSLVKALSPQIPDRFGLLWILHFVWSFPKSVSKGSFLLSLSSSYLPIVIVVC